MYQAREDTVSFEPFFRAGAEGYLAEDHHAPDRLFGVVVGGRHALDPEEGEEILLLGSAKIRPQCFGGLETKRLFAEFGYSGDTILIY